MRKILILGLIGLGASTGAALAREKTCSARVADCTAQVAAFKAYDMNTWRAYQIQCNDNYSQCLRDGSWGSGPKGSFVRGRAKASIGGSVQDGGASAKKGGATFGGNMSGPGSTPGMSGSNGRVAPSAIKPRGATFGGALSGGSPKSTADRGALSTTPGPAFGANQFSGGKK